jgi:aspartate aminotransferase
VQLTERINRIQISPTSAVIAEAEKLKSRGVDIADFGPGEPDFPTPDHIKKAAIRAIEQNFTKYTPTGGILPLREAICEWHKRELGSHYDPKECVVNVGGKHSIFNVVSVLVQQGDEVIIPAPYWVSYPDIVKYAGGTPVFVESRAEDEFSVTATVIAKAITPRTRMVILSSPNNPTGGVIPPDEYERILAVCKKHNVWLMGDECYSHFTYDPHKPYSIASHADSKAHVIIIGSMSKTFAMTGWRIGYTLAPEALVQATVKLQSQSTSNPTSIAQHAALEAMRGPMDTVPIMLAEYAKRRKRIVEGLRAIPGVTCEWPGGAFYAFPNVAAHLANGSSGRALAKDTSELAKMLLDQARVALVPGDAFGAPGYLRLSYATSIERIDEGLRRLDRFFSRVEAAA